MAPPRSGPGVAAGERECYTRLQGDGNRARTRQRGSLKGSWRHAARELAKLPRKAAWALQLNEHIAEPGDVVFRHACKLGFVGGTTGSAGVLD